MTYTRPDYSGETAQPQTENRTPGQSVLRRGVVLTMLLVVIFGLTAAGVPGVVLAQDDGPESVPAAYYGNVTVNGDPAPVGTEIMAEVDGEQHGSIEVTEPGSYGGPNALDEKLVVKDAEAGDTVTFVVHGVEAEETVTWESGDVQEVTLTFTNVPKETESDDDETTDGADSTTQTTESDSDGQDTGGQDTGETDQGTTQSPVEEPESASLTVTVGGTNPSIAIEESQSVSRVEFESESEMDATVSVSEVTETPAPEPEGQNFVSGTEITFESGDSESISTVRIGIKSSTLEASTTTAENLVLQHLDEETETWEQLETSVVSESDEEILLEAPSAGFSTYGVFATEDETTEETTTDDSVTTTVTTTQTEEPTPEPTTAEPTTEQPTTTETGTPGFTLGLTIVALLGAALHLRRRD